MFIAVLTLLFWVQVAAVAVVQAQSRFDASAPLPTRNDPVMAGYDLVAYHSLDPQADGVPGSSEITYIYNGYLYYFSSDANKALFMANPGKYLPKYGGFCAWGIAWEHPPQWPWAADHMGPPCGPRDGWAILDGRLYCSIWRSYQDDFNAKQEEGIRLADDRWTQFYGVQDGPMNNGCYAWNWQECFARSIYTPGVAVIPPGGDDDRGEVEVTNPIPEPTGEAIFPEQPATTWSAWQSALQGSVSWRWDLSKLDSVQPKLIVELVRELDGNEPTYVAFGVAEQLMQGALVVCSQKIPQITDSVQEVVTYPLSTCQSLLGAGMGTTVPSTDPVQPTVVASLRNDTHSTIRFSANLFACWSDPEVPARVLLAKGWVSGNGDPQPHLNDPEHRQAITGIQFLQVVNGYEPKTDVPDVYPRAILEALPDRQSWGSPVVSANKDILGGRVRIQYDLFRPSGDPDIVQVQIQNVPIEFEYIGFGFAETVMTGLIMTCTSPATNDLVTCHQWRGQDTNLYPRNLVEDPGGWFLEERVLEDDSVSYILAGRVSDVIDQTRSGSVRAICAMGQAASDSGTPLMHSARDREGFLLPELKIGGNDVEFDTSGSSSDARHFYPMILLVLV